jgi:isoleucyl-tRNA synthetase
MTIDDDGNFKSNVPDYQGKHFKEADPQIIKDLKDKDRLIF